MSKKRKGNNKKNTDPKEQYKITIAFYVCFLLLMGAWQYHSKVLEVLAIIPGIYFIIELFKNMVD